MTWNSYFGWDNGVQKHLIYRGTDVNGGARTYSLIDSVPGSDTIYSDNHLPDKIGNYGLCYYVEAIQNPGSLKGTQNSSKSFSNCILGELLVFVPTAFNPVGVNHVFRPEGSYIDYVNSSLEIFDRWGGLIIKIEDITNGWNGKDVSGKDCGLGVYYYRLNIKSPNGQKTTKIGLVTLID